MIESTTLDQLMDIRGAIRDWLEKNGYAGLSFDDCGCRLDDLIPCGLTDNALVCNPFKVVRADDLKEARRMAATPVFSRCFKCGERVVVTTDGRYYCQNCGYENG